MDTEKQISHIEREVQAAKFKIKELKNKAWQQWDKPERQRKDFEPEIQQAQNNLVAKRRELATLIVQHYNLYQ